jgi:hypothetical protein
MAITIEQTTTIAPTMVSTVQTARGMVYFYAPASRELIEALAIDPGIGAFWHYRDGWRQKETLLKALEFGGSVSVAVVNNTIVGYLLLCPPGPHERWEGVAGVYETSIEVSRAWRGFGIADWLLRLTLSAPYWDRCVIVAQGYNWHWDVEHSHLGLSGYREMFRRLHEGHGFAEFRTDDPEIAYEPGNILMARLGEECPRSLRRAFYEDLYRSPRRPSWLEALLATN